MSKPIILFFLFLFSGNYCFAQLLQGKIVDDNDGSPIPFVSIGIVGTNIATISNENGEFVLKNTNFPCKIRYSHISYLVFEQDIEAKVSELYIKLKPAAINLSEVNIDPYKGQKLIKEAIEKSKNFTSNDFYGKAFYRQLTTLNNKASQIYELFYDLKLGIKGVKGWLAKQSRFAELHEGTVFSMSNQSYLTFSFASTIFEDKRNGKYVTLKNLKDFECTVERYIEQKNQNIAIVSCKYKGNKKQYYVNSTFFIGTEDKYIYRIESSIFNLPMKFSNVKNIQIPPIVTTIATFNQKNTPLPIIESVSTKLFLTLSTSNHTLRPLISSMLSIYEIDSKLNNQKFLQVSKDVQDKNTIESIEYNPDFWKNNPIVKQTALEDSFIKMMESKSAFGTMIEQIQ